MTTATPVLADLLDAIVNRLGDIAAELRSNLSDPALAEVRNAARAAERAYVLLSPWVPHVDDAEHGDIMAAVEKHLLRTNAPMHTGDEFDAATIEATALEGSDNYVCVTVHGCAYLVIGEIDGDDDDRRTTYAVVGRYPQ